jgi:hypothetical protein
VSEHGTDWEKLRRLSDADIHAALKSDPDATPTDEAFWKTAELVLPQRKPVVTIPALTHKPIIQKTNLSSI